MLMALLPGMFVNLIPGQAQDHQVVVETGIPVAMSDGTA